MLTEDPPVCLTFAYRQRQSVADRKFHAAVILHMGGNQDLTAIFRQPAIEQIHRQDGERILMKPGKKQIGFIGILPAFQDCITDIFKRDCLGDFAVPGLLLCKGRICLC